MKIGVFDSGAGGLTVTKSLLESKLFAEIIYYGDTARVPYGNKDKQTIIKYSIEALEIFNKLEIEMLIVACNTVSVTALQRLKEMAHYPVIGMVDPAIWYLNKVVKNKRKKILIIGTNVTIASGVYQKATLENGFKDIFAKATGLLVSLVEENIYDGPVTDSVMKYYFESVKDPDVIILACTHFPLLKDAITKYFPKSMLIHSGDAIVEWLKNNYAILNQSGRKTKLTIFSSDNTERLCITANKWLKTSVRYLNEKEYSTKEINNR